MTSRNADTSTPVLEPIASRWSPRAFDETHAFAPGALRSLLEAARWAPSARNTQPWRFIVAHRGSTSFARITDALVESNANWARRASALIVNTVRLEDEDGSPLPWSVYDLGQAVSSYSLQARSEGLYVHQMGGFDHDAIRESFNLERHIEPISVAAVGVLGDPAILTERQQSRETAPRARHELGEIVLVDD
ncbi:MAG: nitroreductase family protein [Leucobacter sp.]|nr:nitroreductase family protein [Leucobacter sp.]